MYGVINNPNNPNSVMGHDMGKIIFIYFILFLTIN